MLKILAIGNLGKDATVNTVNGKNVINFSIASSEKWTDTNGEKKEKTTWIECAFWTDKSGLVPYLTKGTQVFVEGNGDVRQWTDSQGKSGSSITCRVSNIQLLGSVSGAKDGGNSSAGQTVESESEGLKNNGKLPF